MQRTTNRKASKRTPVSSSKLERAQQASASSSFNPAASQLCRSLVFRGYVFPVGGGPGVVSASHTHHDIRPSHCGAMGSPLYALATRVVRSWSSPDPACGSADLRLRGQVWTYCHLVGPRPDRRPGRPPDRGEAADSSGATGRRHGPHLHLQSTGQTWPSGAWFEAFAGQAFTWTDGDPPAEQEAPGRSPSLAERPSSHLPGDSPRIPPPPWCISAALG